MSKKKNLNKVIITVTDEALPDIHKLADQLGSKGLNIDEIMPMTGVIVGSLADDAITGLKNIKGVMSVEKEQAAQLPPPDDLLQ